ncbi:magnesium chelatase subunit D [Cognatishimia sp. F0-27]|uniref:magnesium chelatase subunit D n=1 Tax=Cognatishimia sp. F0-27 TaxID=2816855 RepID=UPI001D0C48D1|nr:magnesium chelatase subunit D [Cognatishimia sp. F0-27]MCC1492439.1 magnesium chelatase subunit D [Cognatishimia sp. F0-27]
MIEDAVEPWVAGQLALCLLAVDPVGLKGVHLRARACPVRDGFLKGRPSALADTRRFTPAISDVQLFGGIDISATLAAGRVVTSEGLLAQSKMLMLAMAERCDASLAARLAQVLDRDDGHSLILLDEGAEPDERAPDALTERLAFSFNLDGLRAENLAGLALDEDDIIAARGRLATMRVPEEAYVSLTHAAVQFGIPSMRPPTMALRAAMAHAALMGRDTVGDDDLRLGAQLVYAHRATQMPPDDDADDMEPPADQPPEDEGMAQDETDQIEQSMPDEMMIEAIAAILPPDLLAVLADKRSGRSTGGAGGAGRKHKGNRRGRPLPARPGHPGSGSRIDVVATLRAAAPWQPVRRRARPDAKSRVIIHPSDIHLKRYEERSDRLIIFAVDASGSAAVARLAEAKGAVELMLADAYAQRDHVALVAFRGEGADLALPPTRSLVQVKRRLSGLPGGGGTPLAAGLRAAADLARHAMGQGLSPSLALLTDGRANVALPGSVPGRASAQHDAEAMARFVRQINMPIAVVDTANRPQAALRGLTAILGGSYLPLPRADAARMSKAIGAALES